MSAASKPTSLKLDEEMKDRVQHLAVARQRTPHWIMVEAVRQYVDREEKREQYRRDALAAWSDYQETRLHVTGKEVLDWMDSWGSERDGDTPECHK